MIRFLFNAESEFNKSLNGLDMKRAVLEKFCEFVEGYFKKYNSEFIFILIYLLLTTKYHYFKFAAAITCFIECLKNLQIYLPKIL